MNMYFSIYELKRLADIGSIAIDRKMPLEAENIFNAIIPFCPPKSNGPLIGLAMARYAQGDVEKAISILRDQALQEDPLCADSNVHLAMILRSLDRKEESDECLGIAKSCRIDDALSGLIEKIERGRFDE